jgi:hypothetical protein
MTAHNNLARDAAECMLYNWKHGEWSNEHISQNIFLSKSPTMFPAPDGSFRDPDNELLIAVEFKPASETKRGILTGLGQCIAYLNKYSVSYFICPEYVEGFKIDTFIDSIFEKNKLNEKIPVGLISYNNNDPTKLTLLRDISTNNITLNKSQMPRDTRYWAKYIDTTPNLIWLILDLAFKTESTGDRRKIIWESFFNKYYFPINKRNQFEAFESEIKLWDRKPMKPFSKILIDLNRKIVQGLSHEEARRILAQKINPNSTQDNLFNSYRKNYFPFIDHLGLWDDNANLTDLGYELHKNGKLNGSTSNAFKDCLAKIILIQGKHLDLILDIEKATRNQDFKTSEEARIHAYNLLETKGLVKKNENRSIEGNKKYFSNEMQLWSHLNILVKDSNRYFIPKKGFTFNWEEITRIISS